MSDMYMWLGTQDLTGKVYGQITTGGGYWKVKQSGVTSLFALAKKDTPEGSSITFGVTFATEAAASTFLAYCYLNSPENPDFDEDVGANLALYVRTSSWYYRVWGVVVKAEALAKETMDYIQYSYSVTCYLYSPYSRSASPVLWSATNQALPQTQSLDNSTGHKETSFDYLDITCLYGSAHVADLALAIGSLSSDICDAALSDEVWSWQPELSQVTETYEDLFSSDITKFNRDTTRTGTPTYVSGAIRLAGAATRVSAYYRLSGPNRTNGPVRMWAELAGTYLLVQVSSDAVNWTTVLTAADFQTGVAEYVLEGTDYLTDVYVRFYQNTATTTYYSYLYSVKFEAKRWVEADYPIVAAGATSTATLSGTGNVTIEGKLYPERKFI